MNFVDPKLMRPGALKTIRGLAVVLPIEPRDEAFLITGGGNPTAVFLSGSYLGHAMPIATNDSWSGMIYEGIEIEVDLTSSFESRHKSPRLGSIIRTEGGIEIAAILKTRGFNEDARLPLDSDREPKVELEQGFARWRAIWRVNGEVTEVFTFEAAPPAT